MEGLILASRGKSSTGRGAAGAGLDLAKVDYERLAEFRYVLRRFLIFSENAAKAAGLTAQHHQALLAIKGFPGRDRITTGELAERLGIRHHSAVGLVDRLASNALVRRRHGLADRRQVFLELTPQAAQVLARLSAAHRDELGRLAPVLKGLLAPYDRPRSKPA